MRQALDEAGVGGGEITAVEVAGPCDGVYLVDEVGGPARARWRWNAMRRTR